MIIVRIAAPLGVDVLGCIVAAEQTRAAHVAAVLTLEALQPRHIQPTAVPNAQETNTTTGATAVRPNDRANQ